MKSPASRACDISPGVRKAVMQRDGVRCILCGRRQSLQIAHYIARARLGHGIPQNLVTLCAQCHFDYDNGKYHREYKKRIEDYLKVHYPEWDENKLQYTKGMSMNEFDTKAYFRG